MPFLLESCASFQLRLLRLSIDETSSFSPSSSFRSVVVVRPLTAPVVVVVVVVAVFVVSLLLLHLLAASSESSSPGSCLLIQPASQTDGGQTLIINGSFSPICTCNVPLLVCCSINIGAAAAVWPSLLTFTTLPHALLQCMIFR